MPEVGCDLDEREVKSLKIKFTSVLVYVFRFEYHRKNNSFFKISYRIFENKRLFFKKMYKIRTKQL